jgi:hypothetical protein
VTTSKDVQTLRDTLTDPDVDDWFGALCALDRLMDGLQRLQDARGNGLGAVPDESGGPGREETYWLRRKLRAAVTHLRDLEDYYRFLGGLPEGFNMLRADRARDLHQRITEDFINGKRGIETRAELEARLQAAERALREVGRELERFADGDTDSLVALGLIGKVVFPALAAAAAPTGGVNEPGEGGAEGSVGQTADGIGAAIGDAGKEVGLAAPGSLTSPGAPSGETAE